MEVGKGGKTFLFDVEETGVYFGRSFRGQDGSLAQTSTTSFIDARSESTMI